MSQVPGGARVVSIERDGSELARAQLRSCLLGGGVAIFPADGLYGLACDPLNAAAAERIQALKGRDRGKSSAVMYLDQIAIREVLGDLGQRVRDAVASLLPGPVTVVVPNPGRRYPLACREDPERLGLRLIGGPLAGMPLPMLQTSANLSGEPAPSRFERIAPRIREGAELAIDGGELSGRPSTVVDLASMDSDGSWRVLREGALSEQQIREALD